MHPTGVVIRSTAVVEGDETEEDEKDDDEEEEEEEEEVEVEVDWSDESK